jgi:hypothetical protein
VIVNDGKGARDVTLNRRTQKLPGGVKNELRLLDREHRGTAWFGPEPTHLGCSHASATLSLAGMRRLHFCVVLFRGAVDEASDVGFELRKILVARRYII